MSKVVSTTDTFSVNEAFSCPLRKIRVPMASLEETHDPKRVEEDRSIAIEAAIVRGRFAGGAGQAGCSMPSVRECEVFRGAGVSHSSCRCGR